MSVGSLLSLLIIFITTNLSANEKYLVVLGGGGEPAGKKTIFDHGLKRIGDFSRNHPEYKTEVSFNGGHIETERIIQNSFQNTTNQKFTNTSFEKIITKYEKMIESGEIKAGDNLLISIDSHGSIKTGDTHNISTTGEEISDLEKLGSKTISLDRLKKLTQLAEEKGINLGIIDLSCYSGNTLNLANSKTCIISGAGSEHYGLASSSSSYFSNLMPQNLSRSSNLEEAFLKSRKESSDITYPMISSSSGQLVQQLLYKTLSPYLNYQLPQSPKKFTDFMLDDLLQRNNCSSKNALESFNSIIKDFIASAKNIELKMALLQLQHEVKAYYEFMDSIKTQMRKAGIGMMKKKLKFCATAPANLAAGIPETMECIDNYNLEMLANLNIKAIYDYYEKISRDTNLSPEDRAKSLALYECYKKMEDWRNYILKQNPHFLKIHEFWQDKYPYLSNQTKKYAGKIIAIEKRVYDLMYQQTVSFGINPCRAFEI
jgi:hypothetical protein